MNWSRSIRPSLLPVLALLAGCAGLRPAATPSGTAQLAFEPQQLEVTPADLELAGKNDEELYAIGQAALAAGEPERAAAAFDRLVDLHPGSSTQAGGPAGQRRSRTSGSTSGGWRWSGSGSWRGFPARPRRWRPPSGWPSATTTSTSSPAAAEVLAGLAARAGLPTGEHIRALTQLGIVQLERGLLDEAEARLRLAVSAWAAGTEQERLDDYHPSQAQYYLGEVQRARFLAVRFDPASGDEEQLARDLEAKATLLLSAQGHYLRAIRMGNGDWAVASGYRIGELYDALHAAMVEAPLAARPGRRARRGLPGRAEAAGPGAGGQGHRHLRADAGGGRPGQGHRQPLRGRDPGLARPDEAGAARGAGRADPAGQPPPPGAARQKG